MNVSLIKNIVVVLFRFKSYMRIYNAKFALSKCQSAWERIPANI